VKLRYKVTGGILVFLAVALSSLAFILSNNSACGPAPEVSNKVELMKAIVYRCYGWQSFAVGKQTRPDSRGNFRHSWGLKR